jgi:hypothetical protein
MARLAAIEDLGQVGGEVGVQPGFMPEFFGMRFHPRDGFREWTATMAQRKGPLQEAGRPA